MSHIACSRISQPPTPHYAVTKNSTYLYSLFALGLNIPSRNALAHILHNNRALPAVDKDPGQLD
jgi:hypothetical protein